MDFEDLFDPDACLRRSAHVKVGELVIPLSSSPPPSSNLLLPQGPFATSHDAEVDIVAYNFTTQLLELDHRAVDDELLRESNADSATKEVEDAIEANKRSRRHQQRHHNLRHECNQMQQQQQQDCSNAGDENKTTRSLRKRHNNKPTARTTAATAARNNSATTICTTSTSSSSEDGMDDDDDDDDEEEAPRPHRRLKRRRPPPIVERGHGGDDGGEQVELYKAPKPRKKAVRRAASGNAAPNRSPKTHEYPAMTMAEFTKRMEALRQEHVAHLPREQRKEAAMRALVQEFSGKVAERQGMGAQSANIMEILSARAKKYESEFPPLSAYQQAMRDKSMIKSQVTFVDDTKDFQYDCQYCNKTPNRKIITTDEGMDYHLKDIHEGYHPYRCIVENCPTAKPYLRKQACRAHINSHHLQKKAFTCYVPGRCVSFDTQHDLIAYLQKPDGGASLVAALCMDSPFMLK